MSTTTPSQSSKEPTMFYLAYGSNMNDDVLRGRRGIKPVRSFPCRVPGWSLVFNTSGLPYQEPTFGSILPTKDLSEMLSVPESELEELHGVVHEITPDEYEKIKMTEGGGGHEGLGYLNRTVTCECYRPNDSQSVVMTVDATTLFFSMDFALHPEKAHPSTRYLRLLVNGAHRYGVAQHYQEYLRALPHYDKSKVSRLRAIGNVVFLFTALPLFLPFFLAMGSASMFSIRAPRLLYVYLDYVSRLIMLLHDYFFDVIFGSGLKMMDKPSKSARMMPSEGENKKTK